MSSRGARIAIGVLLSLVIVVPLTALGFLFYNPAASGKVLPGVTVMGMDLSNLDKTEGVAKIAAYEEDLNSTLVEVKYLEQSVALPLGEIDLNLDEENIVEEALRVGREGNLMQQWKDRQNLKNNGVGLSPAILFDRDKVLLITGEFTQGISEDPINAFFVVDDSETVTVNPGKDGYMVDLDKMIDDLSGIIIERKKPEIELELVVTPPERSTDALVESGVNVKLGSYYTVFNQNQTNRTYNIKLAAATYDDLLVQPGQTVSFNDTVGPRSISAGYRNAPVIVNNELVEGIGGGVCQVSSTIYNAVLLSGLEIVERTCHALPVSYVPLGRDATVVDGALDFVFRNDTNNCVYLKTLVEGGRLTVNIFGAATDKKEVRVSSWVTQEIPPQVVYEEDPNLPAGEETVLIGGASGYRAAAERTFLNGDGAVERRETLGSSSYNPQKRVIAVGTAETEPGQVSPGIITPNTNETGLGLPAGSRNEDSSATNSGNGNDNGIGSDRGNMDGSASGGNSSGSSNSGSDAAGDSNGGNGGSGDDGSNAGAGNAGLGGGVANSPADASDNTQVNPAIPTSKPTGDQTVNDE